MLIEGTTKVRHIRVYDQTTLLVGVEWTTKRRGGAEGAFIKWTNETGKQSEGTHVQQVGIVLGQIVTLQTTTHKQPS